MRHAGRTITFSASKVWAVSLIWHSVLLPQFLKQRDRREPFVPQGKPESGIMIVGACEDFYPLRGCDLAAVLYPGLHFGGVERGV
jgi:hypothetical protein